MTTSGRSPGFDGMYSHLIDEDGGYDQQQPRRPDVGQGARPVPSNSLSSRLSSVGPYRLAMICLAALCAILLISIIAVAVKSKNTPQSSVTAEIQKHTQDMNVSALMATINKLQQDKAQIQKEKDELQKAKDELQKEKDELQTSCTTKVPEVPIICPTDWQLFENSCYLISRVTRDWSGAQAYCQSRGGHLAIIHTAEEQTFLWDLLPRGHWNSYWFGITDGETEDVWKWVDGTTVVGGFWEDGEPNNHINEDCGYIVKTRVLSRVAIKSWYDAPCSMNLPFICEKEMGNSAGASATTTATPQ
ncbi:hypothetical protein INR49_014710 [Caranx melampygus]|nr:hypothetical protein INR49_014710 [Caranx melampygus]